MLNFWFYLTNFFKHWSFNLELEYFLIPVLGITDCIKYFSSSQNFIDIYLRNITRFIYLDSCEQILDVNYRFYLGFTVRKVDLSKSLLL
jgi:hypothetical protein